MKIEGLRLHTLNRAAGVAKPPTEADQGALPTDKVALEGPTVQTTAPVEQIQEVATEPQVETQQAALQFVTELGKHHFQRMVQGLSPQTLPTFRAMGEAANQLAGGAEPDLYFHLSQSLHHLGVAVDNAEERLALSPQADRGQLIAEEMKVQAQALTLLPYASPEVLAEVAQADFKTTAEQSKDSRSLELLRQKLPAEAVQQADAQLTFQPLFQAAQPEQLQLPTQEVQRLKDIAGDYLPTAMGARGVFFRAAAGQAQAPGPEFAQLSGQHALHFISEDGTLAEHSPKVAEFTRSLARPDDPGSAFQAASQASVLLLGIDFGGPLGKEKQATEQLSLQQSLMAQAGPVVIQAAQQPGPAAEVPQGSKRAELMAISKDNQMGEQPDQVSGFNQRLLGMLSEEQADQALKNFAADPLRAALEQEQPQGRWAEHFQLRPGGGQRVRESINAFADTQLRLQQVAIDHS